MYSILYVLYSILIANHHIGNSLDEALGSANVLYSILSIRGPNSYCVNTKMASSSLFCCKIKRVVKFLLCWQHSSGFELCGGKAEDTRSELVVHKLGQRKFVAHTTGSRSDSSICCRAVCASCVLLTHSPEHCQ